MAYVDGALSDLPPTQSDRQMGRPGNLWVVKEDFPGEPSHKLPSAPDRRGQATCPQDEPVDSRYAVRDLTTAPRLRAFGLTRWRLPTPVELEVTLNSQYTSTNPVVCEVYRWLLWTGAARKRLSFLQVESKERCSCSEKPPWISGPSSLAMASRINSSTARFLSLGVSLMSRMISPPSSHKLSRCRLRVLRDSPWASRSSRNGVNTATICSPGITSRSSPHQLAGQVAKSGQ